MDTLVERPVVKAAEGFGGFFEQTWPDLVAYCHKLTGDAALAEELTQEAMTRVCVRFPLLREPRPYAFRVATNLAEQLDGLELEPSTNSCDEEPTSLRDSDRLRFVLAVYPDGRAASLGLFFGCRPDLDNGYSVANLSQQQADDLQRLLGI